jgi:pyranose oxidase
MFGLRGLILISFSDLEPQVTTRGTFTHPWHTLIHREAFHYGTVAEDVDPRLVVDLRFLGHSEPRAENAITFDKDLKDAYGMPRANFTFKLSDEDERRNELMVAE